MGMRKAYKPCSIDGCHQIVRAYGWCQPHYMRFYRHGTVGPSRMPTRGMSIVEKLLFYAVPVEDGCWGWTGQRNGWGGYGRIGHTLAHRASYQAFIGQIPAGMLVLHHCDNPPCVNPAHLWLGTSKDNAIDRDRKRRGANGAGPYKYMPAT